MKSPYLAGLLLIGALGCQSSMTAPLADYSLTVHEYAFTPDSLNVLVGKVVQWTNDGTVEHTVTSDSAKWSSRALAAPGGGGAYGGSSGSSSTQITFTTPGRYPYHCSIHPTLMHGVIIVS